ncbi:HlyD family efflux transporter periplasmic adaptor subunit [Derxia lacustris]|uniref:HlyD family efflux transporter periplasmic adaptor subunit n=1 Tax=Derxia lacustris TaxID=764842 RepID=UPI000A176CCF|nr:HlyD family efflux transporter periplasmic adaptor subunit [Derxia lacustris]
MSRSATGRFHPGDARFLDGLRDARIAERTPRADAALWLMALLIAAALGWACVARVDEITKAEGRVVPDGREQLVASLEGGLLAELLVRDGELVQAGQPVARLDPTRAAAQSNEGRAHQLALRASLARLDAELRGGAPVWPAELAERPDLRRDEAATLAARRRALDEALAGSRASLELARRELALAENLAARGLQSEMEVIRLRRAANDAEMQIAERQNRFRQDAAAERARLAADLAASNEQQITRRDVLERGTLLSPVRGIVKNIRIATRGGVVGAGAPVMDILPVGERLKIEARVKPADLGFLRVGLPAQIKLSAYDYYSHGGLSGRVEYISPDALSDERAPPQPDGGWFRVIVSADASTLAAHGEPLPVVPGMTATVEIRTGDRTLMDYLLKPVLKSREAFRER